MLESNDEETKRRIIKEEMSRLAKRRWSKLNEAERSEYAKKLAKARWKKKGNDNEN